MDLKVKGAVTLAKCRMQKKGALFTFKFTFKPSSFLFLNLSKFHGELFRLHAKLVIADSYCIDWISAVKFHQATVNVTTV